MSDYDGCCDTCGKQVEPGDEHWSTDLDLQCGICSAAAAADEDADLERERVKCIHEIACAAGIELATPAEISRIVCERLKNQK